MLVPSKRFFWASSSNFIFSQLPAATQTAAKKFTNFNYLFSGEFDQVLVKSTEPPKVIDAAAGIILPPKDLTELDRLAYTVNEIDRSCATIPKGALKYTPTHTVVQNEAFRGHSVRDANNLSNWQHWRNVEQDDKQELIARHEAIFNDDFLDVLSADRPKQCWSIMLDCTQSVVIVRNQMWPGFFAYHRCNTSVYGSLYIGDGICNSDLPFML